MLKMTFMMHAIKAIINVIFYLGQITQFYIILLYTTTR